MADRTTKYFVLGLVVAPMALLGVAVAVAGMAATPNTFTPGSTIVAAEVNANFANHEAAINDNDARIAALEGAMPPVTTSGEALRIVRGFVNPDGTVNFGTGFTAVRLGTGSYRITVDTAFSGIPACMFQTFTGPNAHVTPTQIDTSLVNLTTTNMAGTAADSPFMFLMIGPQ